MIAGVPALYVGEFGWTGVSGRVNEMATVDVIATRLLCSLLGFCSGFQRCSVPWKVAVKNGSLQW